MSLWARKSIALLQAEAGGEGFGEGQTLRRGLGPWNLTGLGVGIIIGAGIFVLTGTVAAQYAGPAVVYSFVLAGLACFLAALCYAEFAAMIPVAGSAYSYGYATLGELVAWVVGWELLLDYLLGAAAASVAWSAQLGGLLGEMGVGLPAQLSTAPLAYVGGGLVATGAIANLPASFLIVMLTTVLLLGIRHAARLNNLIVLLKIVVVLLVIGSGFMYVNQANWHPFVPPASGETGRFGWSGVVGGAGVIFLAFAGFAAMSTAAQETRNPQRNMPIGILAPLAICTVLFILVALVLTGLTEYAELDAAYPGVAAIARAGSDLAWLRPIARVGAVIGLASVALVLLMAQPRVCFAMARDGLLPPALGRVHARFRTPYIATALTGALAAVVAAIFPAGLLAELVAIGALPAFVAVSAGVLVLRYRQPNIPRPFRTPLVPLVPVLAILAAAYMMMTFSLGSWLRLLAWMTLGLIVYFGYGRTRSHLGMAHGRG